MIKWLNRNIFFDKGTRRRFMVRLQILFNNELPASEMLSYILDTATDKPVRRLMESALYYQGEGLPWAQDWALDGYFTEEEALLLTEAQALNGNAGFNLALGQLIEDEKETMSFWGGIMKTRYPHLIISLFVVGLYYYITQIEREKFAIPFDALGGDVSEVLLMQVGDFLTGPLLVILLVWFVVLTIYRNIRERTQTIEARNKFKKFKFFTMYDLIFEYRVISTITAFMKLETNTAAILNSLQQIYKTPYQQYRIGEVVGGVQLESKKLLDSLEANIVEPDTHKLLKMAAPREDVRVLAEAFDLTRRELQEKLLAIYARLSNIPLLITVLLVASMIFGILDLNTSIQASLSEAEQKALGGQ